MFLHRQALLLQIVRGLLIVQLKLRVAVVQVGQFLFLDLGFLVEA